ncbi:ATP-binding protein [Salipaludibacillus aurantiacus]|uniref:Uncharacterized protein YhaN n=1 Tax=Salipaludibacillus aurantiacus TaxID=1601833 RepID=A0A1H9RNL0_9BACI|nr:AAA family ATPase [Salipaludibacillus aurantiacus]SER74085.1 Uncharacterized protein YhaN [Salipaludibacillus aurantiacus]
MQIKKIKIYGFGKWVDCEWDFPSGMSVIYGDNESGKSTLMAFIYALFFGFPPKREGQYHPRETERYGGAALIDLPPYENIFIERVAGRKQKGKVTVQYADGRTGDERELEKLLKGLDAGSFKGIFHFDLDGLQEMKNLNPEELNRYLYDAGMSGASRLSKLEKTVQQETDRLFKPKGKKTDINALAEDISRVKRSLQEWETRLDKYSYLQIAAADKEKKINKIHTEQKTIQQQVRELDKRISLSPLVHEWFALKESANKDEKITFPAEGIYRLKEINNQLEEKEVQLDHEEEAVKKLISERSKLPEVSITDDLARELSETFEMYPVYKKTKEEVKQLKFEEKSLINQKSNFTEEWQLTDKAFNNASVNTYITEKFDRLKKKWHTLMTKETKLVEEEKKQQKEKNTVTDQLETEKTFLLDEDKVKEFEETVALKNHPGALTTEKKLLKDQIEWLENEEKKVRLKETLKIKQLAGTSLILLIAAVISFFTASPAVILTFLFLTAGTGAYLIFSIRKREGSSPMPAEKEELARKVKKIEEEIQSSRSSNKEEIENLLANHKERNMRIGTLEQRLIFIKRQIEQWEEEWEELHEEWKQAEEELAGWQEEASLPQGKDILYYDSLLNDVKEWKSLDAHHRVIADKHRSLINELEKYEQWLFRLSVSSLGRKDSQPADEEIRALKIYVEDQNALKENIQQLTEKIKYREEALIKAKRERDLINNKKMKLFEHAGVEKEEDFRAKAKLYDNQQQAYDRMNDLWLQITAIIPVATEREGLIRAVLQEDIDETGEQERLLGRAAVLEEDKNDLITEKTESINEMKEMEERGTYEELQQRYISMKEKLNEWAKEWAVLKTSQHMIRKVKEIYEKERQPKVMKRAQSIFRELTSGSYLFLFAPLGEERFIVERSDGQRFDPAELSRGTGELLYLSLRLGLAIEDKAKTAFPLFMDETLVNMDKNRRKKVIRMLHTIAQERQIFFFTCHNHLRDEFKETSPHLPVLYLNDLKFEEQY